MKEGHIYQGYGFYSNMYTTSLTISTDKITIGKCFLEFNNGSSKLIDINAHEIKIAGTSNVLMRQPTIDIEGNCSLSKLYTFALLYKSIGITGYDTKIQGKLILNIVYGDVFTVANNFIFYGKIISDYKKYNYDELYPLKQSLHVLIIICLLYLSTFVVNKIHK
jgi:hypothetical protein